MSDAVVYEMIDSMSGSVSNEFQTGEQRTVRRRYVIGQTEGFNDTVQQIEDYVPQYVSDGGGFFWVRRTLDVAGIGNKYFDCTATYETLLPKDQANPGGQDPTPGALAWDTSGNTERIYQALSEERFPNDAADFEEAINVNGMRVEGLDKVVAGMRYSETWIFSAKVAFDCDYVGNVFRLTGTTNKSKFRCFDPEEALFLGARCQWQGDQPFCSITFDFDCRPNDPAFYVKAVPPFPKKGWEYVWIRYQDDVNSDTLIRKPVAAYKNKIYKDEEWNALRINNEVGQPAPDPAVPVPPRQARQP
jgi:hypothetical protein